MKCDYCFTDAGDQKCVTCDAATCNKHIASNNPPDNTSPVCIGNHEKPKATPTPVAHEDDSAPKPRVKVTKPSSPKS